MAGIDAKFLYAETASAHMHTVKVVVADVSRLPGGFSFDEVAAVLGRQIRRLPPLRRRMVPVPLGLGHPYWVEDPAFDLARHLVRRVAEPPGDLASLARTVAAIASTPLPRDRPLWELSVVEGLAGGRIAVVVKLHHAVADGGAAVNLLQNIVAGIADEGEADGAGGTPPDDGWRPERLPGGWWLVARSLAGHARRARRLPRLVVRSVRGLADSERRRRSLPGPPPLPFQAPRTSLNVPLTPARTFAMATLDLEACRAVRRATGVTLNDVFVAACGGALRRYLAGRGELPRRSLVASVPVAIDRDPHRLSGNRVDHLYVSLGTHLADPAARLAHVHALAEASKEVRRALGHELMEERADLVVPPLYAAAVRAWTATRLARWVPPPLNLVCSNVPGPRERITFGPVVVEGLYSVGPILEGIGVNITAWSHAGDLCVSVLGCPTSLPDPWALVDLVPGALAELVAATSCAVPASRAT